MRTAECLVLIALAIMLTACETTSRSRKPRTTPPPAPDESPTGTAAEPEPMDPLTNPVRVKVLEVNEAKYNDFADETTRKLARRTYLHEKVDAYTAELRKNDFTVEVYEDRLVQLAQQEADMVKTLAQKAHQPGSVTQKRVKELQEFMQQPSVSAGTSRAN